MNRACSLAAALALSTLLADGIPAADGLEVVIHAGRPGAKIAPTLWGIFFEDINLGADGGLCGELVKNRAFEFPDPLLGWSGLDGGKPDGSVAVREADPFSAASPHHVRVTPGEAGKTAGLVNEGFRGMGVRKGESFVFSAMARKVEGEPSLRVALTTREGAVLAEARLGDFAADWKKATAVLRASATEAHARLRVEVRGPGALDLDVVSLFPAGTWKLRAGGLRADLVQALADLKPGFVRFPGGCIVEGKRLATRYQWKATIGKPEERPVLINRWNDEFQHRPTPDYFQSFGLGFFELFQLCEDIGAEPLPVLNCGMACQFNSGELVPLADLDPFIQDALDLIEFANGPAESAWGRRRAEMGHPAPFGLKLLGVGNEQWGPGYIERYERFAKALKAAHPQVMLVAGAGPSPADDRFTFAWEKLRALKADIVDEHCYDRPDWFFGSAGRYDSYDRAGPKVFMGEYAAQSVKTVSPDNRSTWECALSEAAFMTGLERNADVVRLSSYAPLFAHADGWQWKPDLIWFDNLRVLKTTSYLVQQAFSRNRGDVVLPVAAQGGPTGKDARLYFSASRESSTGDVILKAVNGRAEALRAAVRIEGAAPQATGAVVTRLAGPLDAENTFDAPERIAPARSEAPVAGGVVDLELPPYSLSVVRIPAK